MPHTARLDLPVHEDLYLLLRHYDRVLEGWCKGILYPELIRRSRQTSLPRKTSEQRPR